jgi:DNA-binding NtrC family response regulator/tetratricopeptide (TPR) repeat protein
MNHAVRFLAAHDVYLAPEMANYALRSVIPGARERLRPFGIALQPRGAFDAIHDALATGVPPGASAVAVTGEPNSGLRTLQVAAARTARLEGYVPLAASMLREHRWIAGALPGRHVCVFRSDDGREQPAVAEALAHLDAAGARRHVVLSFGRGTSMSPVVRVERMGIIAMTEMVYVDVEHGPRPDQLFDAARRSNGRPGEFLVRLGASDPGGARVSFMVHESVQPYDVPSRGEATSVAVQPPRTMPGVLHRAPERAEALARAGRHGAAGRLLHRALHVLAERGETRHAAACALQLGWLAIERAQLAESIRYFGRARELSTHARTIVLAGIGIGVAWTDEGRLVEAEGALRTAALAAKTLDDATLAAGADAGLGRCLFWQGRHDEAATVLRVVSASQVAPRELARTGVTLARVLMAEGSTITAARTAREALERAREAGDAAVLAGAHRALAHAAAAGGDAASAVSHIEAGLRVASRAHLPLHVARLRLAALEIASRGAASADHRRLAARLAASSIHWPPLLRYAARTARARVNGEELDADTRAFIAASGAAVLGQHGCGPGPNPVADLERLVSISQTAADDRTAICRVAEHLRTRLRAATLLVTGPEPERRVIVSCGRQWSGDPSVAWQAIAGGVGVSVDQLREPCQAAEPLRYSSEIIGSVAARWTPGSAPDPARVGTLLRMGALAIAPNVRAELDRGVPIPAARTPGEEILGESEAAKSMRESIARAARAPFPVLIEGESGSGKELVARAIHRLGPRRDRRFCAINCAALSDELLEAELFGHARGAFTGAVSERAGLFEEADGGTLFLDEIGELSPRAQAKLLRVLQDGQVRRVGENMSRRVDVRIVAATNRRLAEEAAAGRFRADLRFRLDVIRIDVPPLRDRAGDVALLASSFWTEAAGRMGSRATLSPETLAALARYDWPGNVRELQNVIASMAVHSPGRGRIQAAAVPAHVARTAIVSGSSFEVARSEFERRFVKAALASAGGHRARAARTLGVTRQGLAKMLRRLSLDNEGTVSIRGGGSG